MNITVIIITRRGYRVTKQLLSIELWFILIMETIDYLSVVIRLFYWCIHTYISLFVDCHK